MKWLLFDLSGVIAEMYFPLRKTHDLDSIYTLPEYTAFMKGDISEKDILSAFIQKNPQFSTKELKKELQKNLFVPGMETFLEELKENFHLACLTNEGREWAQYKIDALNLRRFFSQIIESNKLRIIKPNPDFFIQALKLLDTKPEECVFIDDSQANCNAAKSIGIESIHFKSAEQLKQELT